eukprot:UN15436
MWFLVAAAGEAQAIHLLLRCVLKERKFSYRALAFKTLPFKNSKQIMEIIVATNCFGLATSYLVVMGDLIPEVVNYCTDSPAHILTTREAWVTIIAFGPCLPLTLLKTLDSLKIFSLLGIIACTYIVTLVVLYGIGEVDGCSDAEVGERCPGNFTWSLPGSGYAMHR